MVIAKVPGPYRVLDLGTEVLVLRPKARREMLELSGIRREEILDKKCCQHPYKEFTVDVDGHRCLCSLGASEEPRHFETGRHHWQHHTRAVGWPTLELKVMACGRVRTPGKLLRSVALRSCEHVPLGSWVLIACGHLDTHKTTV